MYSYMVIILKIKYRVIKDTWCIFLIMVGCLYIIPFLFYYL